MRLAAQVGRCPDHAPCVARSALTPDARGSHGSILVADPTRGDQAVGGFGDLRHERVALKPDAAA
jgi:hypothetical protein